MMMTIAGSAHVHCLPFLHNPLAQHYTTAPCIRTSEHLSYKESHSSVESASTQCSHVCDEALPCTFLTPVQHRVNFQGVSG
jgi:hypothetical protein